MATEINPMVKRGGGGGILGAIGSALGLIGGGILTAVTGGAAAPLEGAIAASAAPTLGGIAAGAAGGAGIGKTVGGLADMAVDPAKPDQQSPTLPTDALSRRAASVTSGALAPENNKILADSLQALNSPSIPQDVKEQAAPLLGQAYAMSRRAKGTGVIS